jgi:hypothetical protein
MVELRCAEPDAEGTLRRGSRGLYCPSLSGRLEKRGVQISALGLGGRHLGSAKDEKIAIDIVHRALDGGSTFYDNAWEYYHGKNGVLARPGPQRPA